jgi:hypothetical protein
MSVDARQPDPECAKLARVRREAAFMGSGDARGQTPPAFLSLDADELARRRALLAAAAGEIVSPEAMRDLVGIGFVHVTTSRLVVTEEGDAWLRSSEAEVSSCVLTESPIEKE